MKNNIFLCIHIKCIVITLLWITTLPCVLGDNSIDTNLYKKAQELNQQKKYSEAAKILEKIAADPAVANHSIACFMLANYYYESRKGIAKNKEKAKKYYDQALKMSLPKAESGDAEAQYITGIITKRTMFKSKLAYEWMEKSAEQGYDPAQAQLAFWIMKGIGGYKIDKEKVGELARKASRQGNMLGRTLLGAYYLNVKKDYKKGFKLIKESADAGNRGGQYMMYYCLRLGKGATKDRIKAMDFLQKAADQGLEDAVGKLRIINSRKTKNNK